MDTDRPPPSTTSIVVATAILAVALGYFIGQGSSLGLFKSTDKPTSKGKTKRKDPKKSWPNSYDVNIHPGSSDEGVFKQIRGADLGIESEESSKHSSDEEDDGAELGQKQGDLSQFEGNKEECKLVLVVRTDLGMGKGTFPPPTEWLSRFAATYGQQLTQPHRQNRSPMLPRDPRLLPRPLQHFPHVSEPGPQTMGTDGPSKSRGAGEE